MAERTAENPLVWDDSAPTMETTKLYILNGQSWDAGQFLNVDANGLLNECVTGDDADAGGIKYLALTSQTDPGNSTTEAEVGILRAGLRYAMSLTNNGTAQAADRSNLEQIYGLYVASNVCYVDENLTTTNACFRVKRLGWQVDPMRYPSADTNAIVIVEILTTVLEAAVA